MSNRIVLSCLVTVVALGSTMASAGPVSDEFRDGAFGLPWNASRTAIQAKYPNGKWDKDPDGFDRFCTPSRQPLLGLPPEHRTRELCFLIGDDGTMASATARMDATLPSLLAVMNRSRTRFGDFDAVKRDEVATPSRFTHVLWTKDAPMIVMVSSINDADGQTSDVGFTVADEPSLYTAGAQKVSHRPPAANELSSDIDASPPVKYPKGQTHASSPVVPTSGSESQLSVMFVERSSAQLAEMRAEIWRGLRQAPGDTLEAPPTSPSDIAVLPGVVQIRSDDGTQTEISVYAVVQQAFRFSPNSNRFEGSILVRAVEPGRVETLGSLPVPIVFQVVGAESDPSERKATDSSFVTFKVFAADWGDNQTVHIVTNLGVDAFPLTVPVQRPSLTVTSPEQILDGWGLETIEVTVTSSDGKTSAGQMVTLQLESGDGAISPSASKLDGSGTAFFRIRSSGTGSSQLIATGPHFLSSNSVRLKYSLPIATIIAAMVGSLAGTFLRRRENPTRRRPKLAVHLAGVILGLICFALLVLGVNVTGYPLPDKAGEVLAFVVAAIGAMLGTAALKVVRS